MTGFRSFDEAWQQFLDAPSIQIHDLERDGRAQGRTQFLAFLVRASDPEVVERLRRLRDGLAGIPGVDPFPEEYWHVTVKLCGFQVVRRTREDDILQGEVPLLLGRAAAALRREESFTVELGRVNAFPTAVFVEVDDDGRLARLNRLLTDALPSLPHYESDGDGYLPHITIARFTGQEALDEVKERLGALRQERGGSLAVGNVEFVRVWLIEEYPERETVRTFPLVAGP
jgi:2'-5' RNA ligase